ncbi:unnamed protein product [Auanema sp. JU1783]|nr:unnamed protein product [Auanema sp. JU1783]
MFTSNNAQSAPVDAGHPRMSDQLLNTDNVTYVMSVRITRNGMMEVVLLPVADIKCTLARPWIAPLYLAIIPFVESSWNSSTTGLKKESKSFGFFGAPMIASCKIFLFSYFDRR